MYLNFVKMADLLNTNLNPDMAEDKPFVCMVNYLAQTARGLGWLNRGRAILQASPD